MAGDRLIVTVLFTFAVNKELSLAGTQENCFFPHTGFLLDLCSSLLSVTVISTITKSNWRAKGLFDLHLHVTVHHRGKSG